MAITSPYVHWPLNQSSGTTVASTTNVPSFPDLVLNDAAGVWGGGWFNGTELNYGGIGDDSVLKNFMDLSTLGAGMIIINYWWDSDSWESQTGRSHFSYGGYSAGKSGIGGRSISQQLWNDPAYPGCRAQTRLSGSLGEEVQNDLIGTFGTDGPLFISHVLRNYRGTPEHTMSVDGFCSTDLQLSTSGPVWDTTQLGLSHGFCLGGRRFSDASQGEFLRVGDKLRDMSIVRVETDQFKYWDRLMHDAYERGPGTGIPPSWEEYL